MLSKNQISYIRSLQIKKYREKHRQFLAEGSKLVIDLLQSRYTVSSVYAVESWLEKSGHLLEGQSVPFTQVSLTTMKRITALSSPGPVCAVADIPGIIFDETIVEKELVLALDDIRDPGNLGTIIRLADWFGIGTVLCSETTVDLYNPKTIQATMGSVARVDVIYGNLVEFLGRASSLCTIYGTFLEGESVYTSDLEPNGILVIGNESNGISPMIRQMIGKKLFIPSFHRAPAQGGHPESLNASLAAAIACSEFRRRLLSTS